MGRDQPPPALRFARQWTLPSTTGGDAGFTLEYPSRHTESISPLGGSRVSRTPSPPRAARQKRLDRSIASGPPSPALPTASSSLASHGATCRRSACLQLASYPAPAAESARSFADRFAQPVGLASDGSGRLFWRRQAQHLKETCDVLEEELSAVYRFLGKDIASSPRRMAAGSQASSIAVKSDSLSYEAVLQERDLARRELVREKEKNFLLRHRLRETETELHQLKQTHTRDAGKQRVCSGSQRASLSSNPTLRGMPASSQHRRSCSCSRSTLRPSIPSACRDRRLATSPLSCSLAQSRTSSTTRRDQPTRQAPVPASASTFRLRDGCGATQYSTSSVPSSVHQETGYRTPPSFASSPTTFTGSSDNGKHSPSLPTRQRLPHQEVETRDLLTSLLCARSPPPNQGSSTLWRRSPEGSSGAAPGRFNNLIGPPRHVFHSGLLGAAAAAAGRKEGVGQSLSCLLAQRATDDRPATTTLGLSSATRQQRYIGSSDGKSTRTTPYPCSQSVLCDAIADARGRQCREAYSRCAVTNSSA